MAESCELATASDDADRHVYTVERRLARRWKGEGNTGS